MALSSEPREPRKVFYVDESMLTIDGYIPSMVTEGEYGHTPLSGNGEHAQPWYWSHDIAIARRLADEANAGLGISRAEALLIIVSSMNADQPIPAE